MTPCPHYRDDKPLMRCELVPRILFPGSALPNCPCVQCRAEWPGGVPPTAKTPSLARITERFNSQMAIPDRLPSSPSPTSFARQAVGIVAAVARWAFMGFPITSEQLYYQRLAICQKCDQYDANSQKCRVCGCRAVKLRMATERCPLAKW